MTNFLKLGITIASAVYLALMLAMWTSREAGFVDRPEAPAPVRARG